MHDLLMAFAEWLEKENSPLTYMVLNWERVSEFTSYGHYFSFFVVVGVNLIVNLRILGLSPRRILASELADQLYPWMWAALGVAFVSGFIYLAPTASLFFTSSYFFYKLLLLVLAVVTAVLIRRRLRVWEQAPAGMPPQAKLAAGFSLLLWIAIMVVGAHVPHQTEG